MVKSLSHGQARHADKNPSLLFLRVASVSYMFYGFSVPWLVIAIYAVSLLTRNRRIADQIEKLKAIAQERERIATRQELRP